MMKQRMFLLTCLLSLTLMFTANAANYYFSSINGNDANNGTTSSTPKSSINLVNSLSLQNGDHIYLERGSKWYQVSITLSGVENVAFDAYGTGNIPVLYGGKVLSSFTNQGSNIWTITDTDLPSLTSTTTTLIVYVDGQYQECSLYPNNNTFLHSESAGSNYIYDSDGSFTTNELINGIVVSRNANWAWSLLGPITSNTATTINSGTNWNGDVSYSGHYYAIRNADIGLDQDYEWVFTTDNLKMYYSGANLNSHEIIASTEEFVINLEDCSGTQLKNIELCAALYALLYVEDGSENLDIENCSFKGAGGQCIGLYSSSMTYTNNYMEEAGIVGIHTSYDSDNGDWSGGDEKIIENSVFKRMCWRNANVYNRFRTMDYGACISVNESDGDWYVTNCFFDSISMGVQSRYTVPDNQFWVENNLFTNYGLANTTDKAAIYMGGESGSSLIPKYVKHNIIIDGHIADVATPEGGHPTMLGAHAFYTDYSCMGVYADSNTIVNTNMAWMSNSTKNCRFTNNKVYNANKDFIDSQWNNVILLNGGLDGVTRLIDAQITGNEIILSSALPDQRFICYRDTGIYNYWSSTFTIDYNKYFMPFNKGNSYIVRNIVDYSVVGSNDLSSFCSNVGYDCNSSINVSNWDFSDVSGIDSSQFVLPLWNWSSQTRWVDLHDLTVKDISTGTNYTDSISVPPYYSRFVFYVSGDDIDSILIGNYNYEIPQQNDSTRSLTVSYSGTGTGSVSPGSGTYPIDTTLLLTATPSTGSIFAGWGGDTTATANPLSVIMWENKSITATFTDTTSAAESDTIAYWRFENNANDETGNHNGTLYGSPGYDTSPAEGSYAVDLDGSGRYMNAGTITLGSSFSISGYIKIYGSSGTRSIFATTSSSSPNGICATVNLSTGVFELITGDGSSSATATSTTGNFTSGAWIKFEYVVDCDANTCSIYIDDVDESSSITIIGDFTDSQTFYVGQDPSSAQLWGRVDALMIVGGGEQQSNPTVTISATDATATEASETTGTIRISRGTETSGNLTVNFTTGGTATLNTDYTLSTSGNVTISDGNTYADITVTPDDDAVDESNETVILTLSSGTGYDIGTPSSATVTIEDDDIAVTISATDNTATEASETTGSFRVSRGSETSGNLTVNFTTGGTATLNTDYTLSSSSSVTITDGNTYADITVTPDDDAVEESDETVILTLSSGTGYVIGSPSSATVTIMDDDSSTGSGDTIGMINFTYDSGYDVTGWTNVYGGSTFNVNLGGSIYFSTSETLPAGVNGEPSTIFPTYVGSTYHFINTDDNTSKAYTLSGLDTSLTYTFSFFESRDDNVSGDRTTTYTIGGSSVGMNPIGNTDSLVVISDVSPDASGEIDITVTKISGQYGYINALIITESSGGAPDPVVTISATDATATEASETTGTFRVSRGVDTSGNLTVNFTTGGTATLNTDYTSSSTGNVTISDGNTYADITITPDDDAIDENDETVIFTLASGTGYTIGTPSSATITIADNDTTISELDTIGMINFTYSGDYAETGWTNIYGGSTFNQSLGDGVYISTSNVLYSGVSGEPSTIFPTNVGSTYHFIETSDNNAKSYNVSGLDTTHSYRFCFFESRDDNVSGDRTTTYTIGGSSVGLNPIGNTDSLLSISGVEADASGEVDITVTKISGQYGYINAMLIIDEGLKRARIRSGEVLSGGLDKIQYYPVPVTNMLNLKNVPQRSLISVYDVVGHKVMEQRSGLSTDLQLNVSSFKAGIYLFRVIDESSTAIRNFKVVKK